MTALFTGGSGLLGQHVRHLRCNWLYPEQREFDILNLREMQDWVQYVTKRWGVEKPHTIIHAAAMKTSYMVDESPMRAMRVNIVGTTHVVELAEQLGAKLIYISTDYVFDGERGDYLETDPVSPQTKYAWSKLGGECAARMYDRSLIIRTSFGPTPFPYERAYADQHTSKLPVTEFAARLVRIVEEGQEVYGVLHVGDHAGRTMWEYAKGVSPHLDVEPVSRLSSNPPAPKDVTLDSSRYESIFRPKIDKGRRDYDHRKPGWDLQPEAPSSDRGGSSGE